MTENTNPPDPAMESDQSPAEPAGQQGTPDGPATEVPLDATPDAAPDATPRRATATLTDVPLFPSGGAVGSDSAPPRYAGPALDQQPPDFGPPPPKGPAARLMRSSSDRMLTGVCGGLGRHTGIDPILFRIGFVALVFAAGTGILFYIALAVLMPSDDGTQVWNRSGRPDRDGAGAEVGTANPPPASKGPRSPVPGVTLAILLIALGVLALTERYRDLSLDPSAYFAIAVAIVGVGLLVSAFGPWRRSKAGLITLGLFLSLGLFVTSTVDARGGFDRTTIGEHNYTPMNADDILPSYRVLMGQSTLDLSRVDFSSTDTTQIDIEVTMGNLDVLVPPGTAVRYNGQTAFGSVSLFGDRNVTHGNYRAAVDTGTASDGDNPLLILNLDVQFGNAEVHRVG